MDNGSLVVSEWLVLVRWWLVNCWWLRVVENIGWLMFLSHTSDWTNPENHGGWSESLTEDTHEDQGPNFLSRGSVNIGGWTEWTAVMNIPIKVAYFRWWPEWIRKSSGVLVSWHISIYLEYSGWTHGAHRRWEMTGEKLGGPCHHPSVIRQENDNWVAYSH